MTVYGLDPAYVQIQYHSAYGAHIATLPTKEWFPTGITGDLGSYTNWNGVPCDGEAMIQEYCDNMMAFYPSTAAIDFVTVFTKASPTDPSIPRATKAITSVGTSVSTNWSKAVQFQWLIRDTAYNMLKLYFLDPVIGNSWDALSDLSGSVPSQDVVGAIVSDNWAWASRAGLQPYTFQKVSYKLNDKLRKEYNMD